MVHRENLKTWLSASGNPWPAKDEFEVGCTLEHAGYYVTWLVAMFGPVESVTSFASCQIVDKGLDVALDPPDTPDLTVGCLRFASGMVARLTCSIVAPHDHALRVFGEEGTLAVKECWGLSARRVTLARRRNRWDLPRREAPGPGEARRPGAEAVPAGSKALVQVRPSRRDPDRLRPEGVADLAEVDPRRASLPDLDPVFAPHQRGCLDASRTPRAWAPLGR